MSGFGNGINLVFGKIRGFFSAIGAKFSILAPAKEDKFDLREALEGNLEASLKFAQWVRVRKEGGEDQVLSGDALTSGQVVQWLDETLGGQYVYFAMDFLLQGEGMYVKRLKKTVYRSFHATLVLHQGSGNMACLFFAGDSMCCYKLIGDFHSYCEVDCKEIRKLPVGDAMLPEYMVFHRRGEIDKALRMLFSDLENADKWLGESSLWSADVAFPGGINNYNRRRRELGLLVD